MFNYFSFSFFAGQRSTAVASITAIPNVSVWFDAATPAYFQPTNPTNNTAITNWNDKSGASHNASPDAGGNKPIYITPVVNGNGAVSFNGVNANLSIGNTTWARSLAGFTIFIVASANRLTGNQILTMSDVLTGMSIYHNGTNWCTGAAGGQGVSTVAGSTTGFHIFGQIYDGTAASNADRLEFRYDKTPYTLTFTGTVGSTTASTTSNLYYAYDGTAGTNKGNKFLKGYIAEILMFTRTLNSSEIVAVESYLSSKWNV